MAEQLNKLVGYRLAQEKLPTFDAANPGVFLAGIQVIKTLKFTVVAISTAEKWTSGKCGRFIAGFIPKNLNGRRPFW